MRNSNGSYGKAVMRIPHRHSSGTRSRRKPQRAPRSRTTVQGSSRWRHALRKGAIAAGILLLIAACSEEEKVKPAVASSVPEGLPDQESWNSTVTFSDSGRVRAILQAGHIRMYEDRKETLLDSGVVVDFFGRDGLHTSRLTAERGKVNDRNKDLEAFDNVVFRSDSGTVVKTEYMYWENQNRKVRGDRFVTLDSPTEHLQGYGFIADQDLKNYTVYGKVSGEAEIKEQAAPAAPDRRE